MGVTGTWHTPTRPGANTLAIEESDLPQGEHRLMVGHEGHKVEATWDYGSYVASYRRAILESAQKESIVTIEFSGIP